MNFLKKIVREVKASFYSPSFYESVKMRGIRSAIVFLSFLILVGAFVFVVRVSIVSIPTITSVLNTEYIAEQYPDELVITIKDGIASTNVAEPYIISNKVINSPGVPGSLLYIDTRQDMSLVEISLIDSMAILSKNHIILKNGEAETKYSSLADIKELTINEEKIVQWSKTAVWFAKIFALPVGIFVLFFVTLLSLVYYCMISLIGAFVPMLVSKIRKVKISYHDSYVISLFAFGPVVVVDMVLMAFGIMVIPSWLIALIFIIVVVSNVGRIQGKEPMVSVESMPPIEPRATV